MDALLEVRGVWKQFPGVLALHNVSIAVNSGEVVALVGENGAGKSTLMRILAGIQSPDRGEIRWCQKTVAIDGPRKAASLGIALIHQELNLADNLDIAGNIFLGRERHRWGWLQSKFLLDDAQQWLQCVGLDLPADTPVHRLSIAQRQLVEIAKALSLRARLLILDEPTSSLTQREAEKLFLVMDELRNQGVAMIYISHRLDEIERIASRVVVLRDGECVGELTREDIRRDRMQSMMVGRELVAHKSLPRVDDRSIAPVLRVQGLTTTTFPKAPVSLELRPGEIVGLAGLVGSGRTELLETLFGVRPRHTGRVELAERDISRATLRQRIAAGIALVPEDRKQHGLVLTSSVRHNLSMTMLPQLSTAGWIRTKDEKSLAAEKINDLRVRCRDDMTMAQLLSGGNQQKLVLGRWLASRPRVLLLDEPTRGIDVGAKHELYQLLEHYAEAGLAILFASSEMEELLRLASRIYVMQEGFIRGELPRSEATEQAIIRLATGSDEMRLEAAAKSNLAPTTKGSR